MKNTQQKKTDASLSVRNGCLCFVLFFVGSRRSPSLYASGFFFPQPKGKRQNKNTRISIVIILHKNKHETETETEKKKCAASPFGLEILIFNELRIIIFAT